MSTEDQTTDFASGRGMLVVISGPSGVGKTTITRRIVESFDAVFSVSATTRAKAPSDVEGQDYHFLSREDFEQRVAEGEFLESASVFGNLYGTLRAPVEAALDSGRMVLLEIDVQGGLQVRRSMPEAFMIFVLPPDDESLDSRLRGRARDSDAEMARRLREARQEIETARKSGAYDRFITNDDLDRCLREVCETLRAEQLRRTAD